MKTIPGIVLDSQNRLLNHRPEGLSSSTLTAGQQAIALGKLGCKANGSIRDGLKQLSSMGRISAESAESVLRKASQDLGQKVGAGMALRENMSVYQ